MKKNGKLKVIIIIILLFLVITGITITIFIKSKQNDDNGIYYIVLEDGTKKNKSPKLSETKYIDNLEITNIDIMEKDNLTTITGTITNNTNETRGNYVICIKLLTKNNEEYTTLTGYIKELKPGENTTLNVSTTFDYSNTYDMVFSKKI